MTLTVGSLFSGIGGIDLGLERAGHKVIWQSEIDPYACKVLQKHWPKVTNHGDIKKIDWATVERPDIICGGYPCQPFSTAGKRQGANDPRHLWPWVRQAISEVRPRYAMLENVRGHLSLGGVQVVGELAKIGYDAEWRIISAAGVGAPHRRDRIIIVAYPNSAPRQQQRKRQVSKSNTQRRSKDVADTNGERLEAQRAKQQTTGLGRGSKTVANTDSEGLNSNGQPVRQATTYPVFSSRDTHTRRHNFAAFWETEPNVGRMAHGVSNRVDRLRGLGNAVMPQVAELVGRLIGEHAKQFK